MFSIIRNRPESIWLCLSLCLLLGAALQVPILAEEGEAPELAEGVKLLQARKWDDAADWFYRFARENPTHAEARRKQGYVEIHRRDGDLVRARQYLEAADRAEPDHPIGLMLLGRICVIAGDLECAERSFGRLIELGTGTRDPMRSSAVHLARFNRALLHERAGELDAAREMFESVLRREPVHAYASFELGLLDVAEGANEAALERLRAAEANLNRWAPLEIWAYPQERYSYARDDVRLEIARVLIKLGRAEEARPILQPLVELSRARNSSRQTSTRRSERALIERDLNPRFENSLYAWGDMLEAVGDKRAAAKAFKEFTRLRFGDNALKAKARKKAKELR